MCEVWEAHFWVELTNFVLVGENFSLKLLHPKE